MRRLATLFLLLAACGVAATLPLRATKTDPLDLAVSGLLDGVPAGQTRYIAWSDIAALPSTQLALSGEFMPGEQKVKVVFLSDFLKALPLKPGADVVLGSCTDGYAAVFRRAFIDHYRPFIVLEIGGIPASKWPPPGLDYNPGPYVITVSDKLAPDAAQFLDIAHKKPWGIASLRIEHFADSFRPAYSGAWANLSVRAQEGREIWVNSCLCCHEGPKGLFAGSKSERPFAVLSAWANANPAYFKRYVRNPKDESSCAQMEAHPAYSDEQLEAVEAFVVGESGRRP